MNKPFPPKRAASQRPKHECHLTGDTRVAESCRREVMECHPIGDTWLRRTGPVGEQLGVDAVVHSVDREGVA